MGSNGPVVCFIGARRRVIDVVQRAERDARGALPRLPFEAPAEAMSVD